MIWWKIISDQE